VSALILMLIMLPSHAQDTVTVRSLAVHDAGNIQYSYQVTNNTSARNISSVSIGNSGADDPKTQANEKPELLVYPVGSYWEKMDDEGDSRDVSLRVGGTFTSPQGWYAGILQYEETSWPGIEAKFSVNWNINRNLAKISPVIYPSQTFQFSVTVPQRDPSYLNGHFTVRFDDNEKPGTYTGSIVPIDTTPPTLSITLSPYALWPPNNKLAQINATITAQDDYDPEPEIKLESITANETLPDGDIQDAQFFSDDRSFNLVAKREGDNMAGRIYTITYSAIDGSGNKATASATVTVPHDQGVSNSVR